MEYIPMGDMSQSFGDGYRWNEGDTKVAIKQLLHGLAIMHRAGITHRDLKPEVCTLPLLKPHYQSLTPTRTYSSTFPRIRPMSSALKSVTLVPQNVSHTLTPPRTWKPLPAHKVTWRPKRMTHRNRKPAGWTSGPLGVSCTGCSPAIAYSITPWRYSSTPWPHPPHPSRLTTLASVSLMSPSSVTFCNQLQRIDRAPRIVKRNPRSQMKLQNQNTLLERISTQGCLR